MLSIGVKTGESVVFRIQGNGKSFLWTTVKLIDIQFDHCVMLVGGSSQCIARGGRLEMVWKGVPINIYYIAPKGGKAQMGFEAPACVGIQRDSFEGELRC